MFLFAELFILARHPLSTLDTKFLVDSANQTISEEKSTPQAVSNDNPLQTTSEKNISRKELPEKSHSKGKGAKKILEDDNKEDIPMNPRLKYPDFESHIAAIESQDEKNYLFRLADGCRKTKGDIVKNGFFYQFPLVHEIYLYQEAEVAYKQYMSAKRLKEQQDKEELVRAKKEELQQALLLMDTQFEDTVGESVAAKIIKPFRNPGQVIADEAYARSLQNEENRTFYQPKGVKVTTPQPAIGLPSQEQIQDFYQHQVQQLQAHQQLQPSTSQSNFGLKRTIPESFNIGGPAKSFRVTSPGKLPDNKPTQRLPAESSQYEAKEIGIVHTIKTEDDEEEYSKAFVLKQKENLVACKLFLSQQFKGNYLSSMHSNVRFFLSDCKFLQQL